MIVNESVLALADEVEFNQLNTNVYLVSNSLHKHYVKINVDTYNLLLLIDGKKTASEICATFNQQYQKDISVKILTELVQNKLALYGVLKGFDESIKAYQKPAYLKLSVMVFNEKTLANVIKFFYFLFHKWVAIPLVAVSVVLIGSFLYLNINLYQSFNLRDSILYLILLMTASLALHEIGHATSTRYFGARHGGIGVGFYLLSPVFYADVTDVWRLRMTQRIVVNLAGVYFETIFCTVVLLIGFFAQSNSIIIVSITIFIRTLFNLNPFLRSDGYWILSDLTGMPNLMHHAFRKVRDVFTWSKPTSTKWKSVDAFLFIYGMINYLCIGAFLYYVLVMNPNSIALFPDRMVKIFTNMINGNYTISFEDYFELIIPVTFFFLAFQFLKPISVKVMKRLKGGATTFND